MANPIVSMLRSSDPDEVREGILQAEEVFTTANVPQTDQGAIREALISIVDADPLHPLAGGAVWALGKLGDATLRPVFVRFLRRAVEHLRASGCDVWQAIIALGDCGEEMLQVSGGILNFDRNHQLAVDFLRHERAK